jgi:hypothetical protein
MFFTGLVSKGKKTVVAYGAAKFAPGGKGEMAVSGSFMTTKMYNGAKKGHWRECDSSTKDQSKFVNRDPRLLHGT